MAITKIHMPDKVDKTVTHTSKTSKPTGLSIKRDGWKFAFSFKQGGSNPYNNSAFHIKIYDCPGTTGSSTSRQFNAGFYAGSAEEELTIRPSSGAYSKTYTMDIDKYYPTYNNKNKVHSLLFKITAVAATTYTMKKLSTKSYFTDKKYDGKNSNNPPASWLDKNARSKKDNKHDKYEYYQDHYQKDVYKYTRSDQATKYIRIGYPELPAAAIEVSSPSSASASWGWSGSKLFTDIHYEASLYDYTSKRYIETHKGETDWVSRETSGSQLFTGIPQNDHIYILTVKAWARGPAGDSRTYDGTNDNIGTVNHPKVVEVTRVFSIPRKPANYRLISAKYDKTAHRHSFLLKFESNITKWGDIELRPVSETQVLYAAETPGNDGAIPMISSWSQYGNSLVLKANTNDVQLVLDNLNLENKILYSSIKNVYDSRPNSSDIIELLVGDLSAPTISSVSVDETLRQVTISATNTASSVPGSYLEVYYIRTSNHSGTYIGMIPNGETTATITIQQTQAEWEAEDERGFKVRARVPWSRLNKSPMSAFTTSPMSSVPKPPRNVKATKLNNTDVKISWERAWTAAQYYEISWSDKENAWETTSGPTTFEGSWPDQSKIVPDLEIGTEWYFRVRLIRKEGEVTTYGAYGTQVSAQLFTNPTKPILNVTANRILVDKTSTMSWTYSNEDDSEYKCAQIRLSDANGTVGDMYVNNTTAASYTFDNKVANKAAGTTTYFIARTCSASGMWSEWSAPASITIKAYPTVAITSTSLVAETLPQGTVNSLTQLPMTITVDGADDNGTTYMSIFRRESYDITRPNGDQYTGVVGEVVVSKEMAGSGTFTVNLSDLSGYLDDDALYTIAAYVKDQDGIPSTQATMDFEVHWEHQAVMPSGSVIYDSRNLVAKITTEVPAGFEAGDTYDIYRLSMDKPERIVTGGTVGESYVDPYPAIGESGGYRIVYITKYGDYITSDACLAWLDINESKLSTWGTIIDFNNERIILKYDLSLSSEWSKQFTKTTYLGGSITGDWNPGVSRKVDVGTVSIVKEDTEIIKALRRLAEWSGICHIRTPDGSSFSADIQVRESRENKMINKKATFNLAVERIGSQGDDGILYSEYVRDNPPIVVPVDTTESFIVGVDSTHETITLAHDVYNARSVTLSYATLADSDIPLTELPSDPDVTVVYVGAVELDKTEYSVNHTTLSVNTTMYQEDGVTVIEAIRKVEVAYNYMPE